MVRSFLRFVFLLFGCWGVLLFRLEAQDSDQPLEVLNADEFRFEKKKDGKTIRFLTGNVQLQQDTTYMFCDVATQFPEDNYLEANGHVRIQVSKSLTITARRLTYRSDTKICDLYNDVTLFDGKTTLKTNRLTYYRTRQYGYYFGGGTLTDAANKLVAEKGYYYSDLYLATFRGKVILTNPEYILRTDTMTYHTGREQANFVAPTNIVTPKNEKLYTEGGFYNTKKRIFHLWSNPWLQDSSYYLRADTLFYNDSTDVGFARCNVLTFSLPDSAIFLGGDSAVFNRRTKSSLITANPWLIYKMEGNPKDTLLLLADTLLVVNDSVRKNRKLRAWKNARFNTGSFSGKGDSLVYDLVDSVFRIYSRPVLFSSGSQVSGDSIFMFLKNKTPDSMAILSSAFLISRDDSLYFNQISGNQIFGRFDSVGRLRLVNVKGNAKSIYFLRDGKKLLGMNELNAPFLKILVKNNRPDKITAWPRPQATFWPPHELVSRPLKLPGFEWREAEQPVNYLRLPTK